MNEPVSQEKSDILNEYSKAIELIEANLTVKKHIIVSYCAVFNAKNSPTEVGQLVFNPSEDPSVKVKYRYPPEFAEINYDSLYDAVLDGWRAV